MPDLTADPALAEAELGFTAPRDLETMCRDLWNWQTKNPLGYDTAQENEPTLTTTTEEAETPVQNTDAPKVEAASEPTAAAPAAPTPKGSPKSKAKKNGNKSGEQDQVAESD